MRHTRRRASAPHVKWCPDCQEEKPLTDFGSNRASSDGRTAYCKPCHNARGKATYTRLYGSTREYHLRRRYGIGVAQYDALVEAQGGLCALCGEREPKHIDHDHATGKIRGVLCSCCNQGLGNFRDNVASLRKAITYLERTALPRARVCRGVYRLPPRRVGAQPRDADVMALISAHRAQTTTRG